MSSPDRRVGRGRWLAFGLWTLVVFTAVPFANDLQSWIHRQLGERALFYGLVLALVAVTALAVRWLSIHRRRQFLPCLLWILAISALIGTWGWWLRDNAGAGHLAAFSILSVLAFRAFETRIRDAGVYLAATVATALAGTVDEFLQWLSPERFWDLADLGVNAGTGALIQLLIWKGIRPLAVKAGVSPRSWRIVVRWLAAAVVLLLACLANTPGRIAWYGARVPGLDYLGQERRTQMIEYGHLLVDPEIGRFKSRLDREELARLDRERGAEAGRILSQHRPPARHAELKQNYPPWRDPLVFEAREHLTLRNRHRGRALKHLGDADLASRHATAALREQLILERYFGNTFDHFGDGLGAAARQQLESLQDPQASYVSEAGSSLWTGFSQAGALGFLIAVLAALLAVERFAARKSGEDRPDNRPG